MKDRKQNGLNGDKQRDRDRGRDRSSSPGPRRRSRSPISRQSTEGDYRSDGYDVNVGANSQSNNTYGLSPQFLQSLGIDGPLTDRILVTNLDYKVGEHKLLEVFGMAGKVTNVELLIDLTGNSEDQAIVEFGHPVEAVQAISMFHKQELFGRPLSV